MKLELYYPAKPYTVHQVYGIRNDIYKQFGFTQHNGIDIALGKDKLIYSEAPVEIVKIAWQPKGGGLFIGAVSQHEYTFDDGVTCRVLFDYLHLDNTKPILVKVGERVDTGTPLATADNTGFSTGPHTHCQYRRVLWKEGVFVEVDNNQANNSFDPTPYYTGNFAKDYRTIQLLKDETEKVGALGLFKQILSLLRK